jgi:hypothetical protein
MPEPFLSGAAISQEDLGVVAALVSARFQPPELEARRIARIRQLLNMGFEFRRALTLQTRCALVNHCGSPGAQDLIAATSTLYATLADYAGCLRQLADEFRELVPRPQPKPSR